MTTAKQDEGMSWNEKRKIVKQCERKHKILLNNMYKISVVLNGKFGGT